MVTLRADGVYILPGVSRPLLAVPADGGGYLLYDTELGSAVAPRFTIDNEGKLFNWHGEQTQWTVADLNEACGPDPAAA